MKKILGILLIFLTCQMGFCNPQTSLNGFEIPIQDIPPSGGKSHSNGLSGGAVTAIALGSTFSGLAALGGLGWYFKTHTKGIACGCACGVEKPFKPIFLADFCEEFSNNKYLEKAFGLADKSQDKKYLFIPDSEIKSKTYNTIVFEIPKGLHKFKIIQVYEAVETKSLDTKLIFSNSELPVKILKNDSKNGVLIKQGQIPDNAQNPHAALVTTNYTDEKVYAIIVEFY